MKQNRFSYLTIIFTVIVVGIFSRKVVFIPLFIGDLLYAVMVYFGICFLFINLDRIKSAIIALLICYSIEALQLYDAEWIIALQNTFFGHYVLGKGFLWSDILAYSFGIIIAYFCEKKYLIRKLQLKKLIYSKFYSKYPNRFP